MIQLERHIEILLLENDCVVVPNFGGFVAHHTNACRDTDDSAYLPPRRLLGFNPKLQVNDNLLTQSYIETYDLCYPEAISRIESEVEELKGELSENGVYEFNDIGTLSVNANGNYDFTPCEAGLLTPSYYGLSSFQIENIDTLPTAEKVTLSCNGKEQADMVSVKVSVLRNAIAIAAAIIAFFLITPPLGAPGNATEGENALEASIMYKMPSPSSSPRMASISPVKNETTLVKTTSQKKVSATPLAQEQPSATTSKWTIVLASGVSRQGAEAYVADLKKRSMPLGSVLEKKGSFRKVTYGNYGSAEEAYAKLATMKKDTEFRDAWVLEMKD